MWPFTICMLGLQVWTFGAGGLAGAAAARAGAAGLAAGGGLGCGAGFACIACTGAGFD